MPQQTDFLVLGSGVAALTFALDAADHGEVTIVTKRASNESNTRYAQGGIAGGVDKEDSVRAHVEDTLRAGAGLCHDDKGRANEAFALEVAGLDLGHDCRQARVGARRSTRFGATLALGP